MFLKCHSERGTSEEFPIVSKNEAKFAPHGDASASLSVTFLFKKRALSAFRLELRKIELLDQGAYFMTNNVVNTLHEQLKNARQVLEGTMEGVSATQCPLDPAGHG